MPKRKALPPLLPFKRLPLAEPEQTVLNNGLSVTYLNSGTQGVAKMELVIEAGRWYETERLVSKATAQLLKESSLRRSAAALADAVDYYGANLAVGTGFDVCTLSVYGLSRFLPQLAPLLLEAVAEPLFSAEELLWFSERQANRLRVELERGETLAYRQFTAALYGTAHPYGYNSDPEDYQRLAVEKLKTFHRQAYSPHRCQLFVAGDLDPATKAMTEQLFSQWQPEALPYDAPPHRLQPAAEKHFVQTKGTKGQVSLRIGQRCPNRNHPDFIGFSVLNTVLGGYFGSRLMTNIREEKGLTYNIDSGLETMRHDAYFNICAEVNLQQAAAVQQEIEQEIKTLQQDLIPAKELEMVKQYLMGNLMTMLDGAFHTAEVIRDLSLYNLPISYLHQFADTTLAITAEQLRDLAQRYWQIEDMTSVLIS